MVKKNKDFKLFGALNNGTRLPLAENDIMHEPAGELSEEARDVTRIIHSLIEELEAFGVYNQRMDATSDEDLSGILEHNRDEEMDHAMMLLEKLRKTFPAVDERMKKYLFQDGNIPKD